MAQLNTSHPNNLIVLVGPTAVGKTALSIRLAEHYQAPILSTDSRQVYKEMNIGTAKPTKNELAMAPHYLINTISVTERYTAGMYERDAVSLLDELFTQTNHCIAVGGSGLYINGLCYGIDDIPADEKVRTALQQRWKSEGLDVLKEELEAIDPDFYNSSDMQNPRRVIRGLEVYQLTGKTYSSLRQQQSKKRNFHPVWIGLELDTEELYKRINQRVDEMIVSGLVEEVRSLEQYKELKSLKTVGYQELMAHFEGEYDLNKAIELIKRNSRHFAKKQYTWFRKNQDIKWFHPTEYDAIIEYIEANKLK